MAQADIAQTGLAQVVARFPQHSAALRRLLLADPEFRGLCEDYVLAREAFACFAARPDAGDRPEVEDYRGMITELEAEIREFLRST